MANGQYHGRKRYVIRIKNPLRLTVEVSILDGKGFSTCRTLRPGAEVDVKVPQPGEYDIKLSILRYDPAGNAVRLGDAGYQQIPTVAVKPKITAQAGPILIARKKDVKSRRWVTAAVWLIPQGFAGRLQSISIQLDGDCEARLPSKYSIPFLPTKHPTVVKADAVLSYQPILVLLGGESVTVKARSHVGNTGTVNVMIQGELYPVGVPGKAPEHVTEKKPRKEPEEPELRSLGDLIEEMRKGEEVKV